MNRREFIAGAACAAGAELLAGGCATPAAGGRAFKRITVAEGRCELELQPTRGAFGFKGVYQKRRLGSWHVASCLQSTSGAYGIGLANQGCMWSDAAVTLANPGCGAEAMMYAMTRHALTMARGKSFTTPPELLDQLFPELWDYGKRIVASEKLRATFALNALVSVDAAAWVLFARENGFMSFDEMIPGEFRGTLSAHHPRAAAIPLVSYAVPIADVVKLVDDGFFFMKIKIGQGGTQEEMLRKDCERVSAIHAALKDCRTPYTKTGKLPYYFDANGRYEKKETLLRFVDHLKKIGAYEQVSIIEEPFDEYADIDVNDIPLRLAADESAHTVKDALERIEMGYKAMALKPIAKTMSMSMKIAQAAYEKSIPCFCADLTVCPVMVEWNKAVAARLPSFPGIGDLGLVETNGHMNFRNWETMRKDLVYEQAHWTRTEKGVFECDADYYAKSGGILEPMPRYEKMYEGLKG